MDSANINLLLIAKYEYIVCCKLKLKLRYSFVRLNGTFSIRTLFGYKSIRYIYAALSREKYEREVYCYCNERYGCSYHNINKGKKEDNDNSNIILIEGTSQVYRTYFEWHSEYVTFGISQIPCHSK